MSNSLLRHAFLLCACALMVIWWWSQRFADNQQTAEGDDFPTLTLQNATSYRYDARGKRTDTLRAREIRHYGNTRDTLFEHPVLHHEAEHASFHGSAEQGRYAADGKVTLEGDALLQRIIGQQADISVRSRILHYDPAAQSIRSDEEVIIDTPESHTSSLGAIWQLERNSLILKQNVRSHYEPNLRR